MTPELQTRIVAGEQDEASGRSVEELAADRDRKLIALLQTLANRGPWSRHA